LKELYAWRDHSARIEDESYPYVLPDHMLLQIAEVLPREMPGIWACCCPVPPLVRRDSHPLHRMILHARALPLDVSAKDNSRRPENDSDQRSALNTNVDAQSLNTVSNRVLKNHDFSHSAVDEEIVSLAQRLTTISDFIIVKERPTLSFDQVDGDGDRQISTKKKRKATKANLLEEVESMLRSKLTPYDRYLLALSAAAESGNGNENGDAKESDAVSTHVPKKRKLYSHIDPVVDETKGTDQPSTSGVQDQNGTPSTVVKKKRRIMESAEPDQVEEVEAPMTTVKKRKKKSKAVAAAESYDYSLVDKTMFSKGASSSQTDVFEPHNEFMNKRGKKGKKKQNMKKGAVGNMSGGWKKRGAAAFAQFDSSGGGSGKGKKKAGKW